MRYLSKFSIISMFSTVSFLFLSASCGDSDGGGSDSTKKLDGVSYVVVDAGSLEHGSTEVSGEGSFAFSEPRKDQGNSFAFTGTIADGGSLSLFSNAETGLENGVEVKFSRTAAVLSVEILVAGESIDISSSFTATDATEELSFVIDIHNGEDPAAHVLIWAGNEKNFGEGTALFNSEEGAERTGQGSGNLWGFYLSNATLTSAVASEPKFED